MNFLRYPKGNRDEWLAKNEISDRISGPFCNVQIEREADVINKALTGLRDYYNKNSTNTGGKKADAKKSTQKKAEEKKETAKDKKAQRSHRGSAEYVKTKGNEYQEKNPKLVPKSSEYIQSDKPDE